MGFHSSEIKVFLRKFYASKFAIYLEYENPHKFFETLQQNPPISEEEWFDINFFMVTGNIFDFAYFFLHLTYLT